MAKQMPTPSLFLLFLLAFQAMMLIMPSEASICETPSRFFTGICFSRRNCGTICEKEGFSFGRCKGLKCVCAKDCNAGGGGGNPGLGPPDQGPPDQGPPDQGPPDQGPPDQGPPDQGPPDQGPPDQGPPEQGPPEQGQPGGDDPPRRITDFCCKHGQRVFCTGSGGASSNLV